MRDFFSFRIHIVLHKIFILIHVNPSQLAFTYNPLRPNPNTIHIEIQPIKFISTQTIIRVKCKGSWGSGGSDPACSQLLAHITTSNSAV